MTPETELRLKLRRSGFSPLPAIGKKVLLEKWTQKLDADADEIAGWAPRYPQWTNTGILTARTPAFDVDIKDAEAASAIENLTREWLEERHGEFLLRFGMMPKRAILFQTNAPFKKVRAIVTPTPKRAADGSDDQKLEFLGDGQQIIAFGIHPDTNKPYWWAGDREPGQFHREDLPHITEPLARDLVTRAADWLVEKHGFTLWETTVPSVAPGPGANGSSAGPRDWDGLIADVRAGRALHDSVVALAASIARSGRMGPEAAYAFCMMNAQAAPRDETRQRELPGEIRRAVDSAFAKFPPRTTAPDVRDYMAAELPPDAEPPPASGPEDYGTDDAPDARHEPADPPLQWIDMSSWDRIPVPERKWAIRDRVPLNQAGLFSGEGGTGKSIIEMMKDVAHVAGKDWLGSMPEMGPAFYLGAEDDDDELHRRFAAIAAHYGTTFKNLIDGGLHVLGLLGQDATLCAVSGKSGRVEVTGLYRQLREAAGDIKPKNISIDTLSRAFVGNEIDRVQVYAFAMHMQALAKVAGGSVTVLSHPSLQGIASGSGISGSTAWHGAFRFRQYLKGTKPDGNGEQPDNDLRELEFKKNQYGPRCETIALRYQRGLFLPVAATGSLDKMADDQAAENLFLELLDKFEAQGRNVSHCKTAHTYAPTMFAKDPKAAAPGLRKELADAMERLFAAERIKVENYGRPSHPHARLARCSDEKEERLTGR